MSPTLTCVHISYPRSLSLLIDMHSGHGDCRLSATQGNVLATGSRFLLSLFIFVCFVLVCMYVCVSCKSWGVSDEAPPTNRGHITVSDSPWRRGGVWVMRPQRPEGGQR